VMVQKVEDKRFTAPDPTRREVKTTTRTFIGNASLPSYGNVWQEFSTTLLSSEFQVQAVMVAGNLQFVPLPVVGGINGTLQRSTSTSTYYDTDITGAPDNGDLQSQDTVEIQYNENLPGFPLLLERTTTRTYDRTLGQLIVTTTATERDATGVVTRRMDISEPAPFRLAGRAAIHTGMIITQQQVRSLHPTDLEIAQAGTPLLQKQPLHTTTSTLVADQASANQIQAWLDDERNSIRVKATFYLRPMAALRPGRTLQVANAPAAWSLTEFYITAIRMNNRSATVEAIGWLAAP